MTTSLFSHDAWSAIVGPEVAQRTRAVDFRDGRLTVECDSAAWSQQMVVLSDRIARETQAHRIRLRVCPRTADQEKA